MPVHAPTLVALAFFASATDTATGTLLYADKLSQTNFADLANLPADDPLKPLYQPNLDSDTYSLVQQYLQNNPGTYQIQLADYFNFMAGAFAPWSGGGAHPPANDLATVAQKLLA